MTTTEKPATGSNREAGLAQRFSETKHNTRNTADHQRRRLLQRLQAGALSTIEARRELDILMPAARVHELRHRFGHDIATVWTQQATDCGEVHRVALYQLRPSGVLPAPKEPEGGCS